MDSFNDDLKQSNLLTTNTLDLTGLIEQYENTLTKTLEKHAPLRQRVISRVLVMPRENARSWNAAGKRQDCALIDRCMPTSAR